MKFKHKIGALLLCIGLVSSLFAASVDTIINQLKAQAGKTLKNPIIFVKYGPDKFDWLAVTSDGKFAAKLEGMNPNGSFRYTIIGNPENYGIKLNVSLTGVTVESLNETAADTGTTPSQNPQIVKKEKIKTADLAITSLITNSGFLQSTSPVRELRKKSPGSFVVLPNKRLLQKFKYTRQVFTEPCPDGGVVTVSVNGAETEADFMYKNCSFEGVTANGLVHLKTYDELHFEGYYKNFSVKNSQLETFINSATISFDFDNYDELKNLRLDIPEGKIRYLSIGHSVFIRNYKLSIDVISNKFYIDLASDYKADCQDEWSRAKTTSPIVQSFYSLCPQGGLVDVKNSKYDVEIRFNPDKSIEIVDKNDGTLLTRYRDCRSVPLEDFCKY